MTRPAPLGAPRPLLALLAALAVALPGCAAEPFDATAANANGDEDDEDPNDEGAGEFAIASSRGGACPVEARLSQGFHGGHDGVDLANRVGTPIFAVMGGKVVASGPAQGYGQWIRIQHDDGSMTEYGHMSRRFVSVGARVKAGQRIAAVGSEGRSTGPHLHLRTYRSASRTGTGNGMNPVEYLRARGVTLPCKPRGVVEGQAAPEPEGAGEGNDEAFDGSVTVWKATTVRASPSTSAKVVANASAGQSFEATCWTEGDTVSSSGFSHDKWVEIEAGGKKGFVSGVFLKGDETGGVTKRCD